MGKISLTPSTQFIKCMTLSQNSETIHDYGQFFSAFLTLDAFRAYWIYSAPTLQLHQLYLWWKNGIFPQMWSNLMSFSDLIIQLSVTHLHAPLKPAYA